MGPDSSYVSLCEITHFSSPETERVPIQSAEQEFMKNSSS